MQPYISFELLDDDTYKIVYISKRRFTKAFVFPASHLGKPVTEIGSEALKENRQFTTIGIPSSIRYIDLNVFKKSRRLKYIMVFKDNPNYSSLEGVLYNKTKTELLFYPPNKFQFEFDIPLSVTKISIPQYCSPRWLDVMMINSYTKCNLQKIGKTMVYSKDEAYYCYIQDCQHIEIKLIEKRFKEEECYHLYDPDSYSCDSCQYDNCHSKTPEYIVCCKTCNQALILNEKEFKKYTDQQIYKLSNSI